MGSPLQSAARNAALSLWQLAQEPLPNAANRATEMLRSSLANNTATNNTSTNNSPDVVPPTTELPPTELPSAVLEEAVHTPADTAPSSEPPHDPASQDANKPATLVAEIDRGGVEDGAVVGGKPTSTPQPVVTTDVAKATDTRPKEPEVIELEGDDALVLHLSHPAREPAVEALRNASPEPAAEQPDTSQDEAIARALGDNTDTGAATSSSSDVKKADLHKARHHHGHHKSGHHIHGHHPSSCHHHGHHSHSHGHSHGHSHAHSHGHSHAHSRGHHKHGHPVKSR